VGKEGEKEKFGTPRGGKEEKRRKNQNLPGESPQQASPKKKTPYKSKRKKSYGGGVENDPEMPIERGRPLPWQRTLI